MNTKRCLQITGEMYTGTHSKNLQISSINLYIKQMVIRSSKSTQDRQWENDKKQTMVNKPLHKKTIEHELH